ncbi:MAG TPA: DUF6491 family protein [Rhizomicrobium sp.]|jgi:hypothetical protein
MTMKVMLAAGLAACVSIPAMAQSPTMPPSASQRGCLRFGEIYNWKALGNKSLMVEDNFHKKFRVDLMAYCEGLQFKERVGFQSAGSVALTCMSPGDDVIVRNVGTGFQRCPITRITPMPANAAPAGNGSP